MRLEFELALRFLRRRSGQLLRGTALAAFCGIALAVAGLVITLALMAGYIEAIAQALQRGNAHLVGFAPMRLDRDHAEELAARIRAADGVLRATPVTYLAALAQDPEHPNQPRPVVLKAVADPPAYTGLQAWRDTDGIPAAVGEGLARSLGLEVGDPIVVELPPVAGEWILPVLRLETGATFSLAFTEFDSRWVIVPLDGIMAAVPDTLVAGIEVEIEDPMAVEEARGRLEAVTPDLLFTDWRDMNRQLFAALDWMTIALFVVLSLVVVVASFQVSSALVVLAIDKRRSAGMLQALGATPVRVWRILAMAGTLLGAAGVAAGLVFGSAVSVILTTFEIIRLPADLAHIYLVDHVPFQVTPVHAGAVAAVGLALVLAASVWPAWQSARRDPIASLRSV